MRKPVVIGNWKLNGGLAENKTRLLELVQTLSYQRHVDIGVCLPYPYLFQAQQLLANTSIMWGAQNVSQYIQGAYTACVSAEMLADFGCKIVIIGHSERRLYSAENSEKAIMRIKRAIDAGITPIYCIGESKKEHEAGLAKKVIADQLNALFECHDVTLNMDGLMIAYEPVWAIGTDQAATPNQAQTIHMFIRSLIAKYDQVLSEKTRIIYGGSLTPDNASALFNMPDIDGGLVGRASLNADAFADICGAAANALNESN